MYFNKLYILKKTQHPADKCFQDSKSLLCAILVTTVPMQHRQISLLFILNLLREWDYTVCVLWTHLLSHRFGWQVFALSLLMCE